MSKKKSKKAKKAKKKIMKIFIFATTIFNLLMIIIELLEKIIGWFER